MTQNVIENKLLWSVAGQDATIQANKSIATSAISSLDAVRKKADADYAATIQQSNDRKDRQLALFASIRSAADQSYDAQITKSNQAYDSAAQAAVKSAETQSQAIKSVIRDIGEQAVALRDLPDPAMGAFAGEQGKGISNQQIGSRVAGLGSIVGQAGGGAAFRDAAQLIQLGSTAGAAGVGVGVLALGIRALSEAEQRGEETTKIATDAQKAYFQAIQSGTTQSIQVARDNAQKQLQVAQDLQHYYQQVLSQAGVAINQQLGLLAPLAKVGEALGLPGATGITKGYIDALAEANKEVTTQTALVAALDRAMGNSNVATNTAIEAEKQLAEVRTKDADQDAQDRVGLAALRRTGTVDQVNAELDANRDRETILRTSLIPGVKDLGLTADEAKARTDELNKELLTLQGTDQLLVQAVLPVVAQREAEVKLLKAQKDASDALNPILQDINKANVDLGQAAEKTATALTAVGQAETDHKDKLVDIQATYDEAATSALQKRNEQLAKIDANAATRALEQRENLNLQIEGLVGRGQIAEAQAAIRAQRLKETQDARQVQQQKDDAQKNYSDQLKAADQQRVKLLKSEQDRYTKELQQRREAYDQAVRDQQFLFNRIKSLRDQEQLYTRSWISAQVTALYQVQSATGNFAANMQSYADRINANIQAGGAAWKPAPAGSSGTGVVSTPGAGPGGLPAVTGTAAGGGRATPTAFDTPSFNRSPGLYISRVPEYHIPVADFNRMTNMGGPSLTFNVGEGGEVLAQKIVTALKPVLDRHGEGIKVQVVTDLAAINNAVKPGGSQ